MTQRASRIGIISVLGALAMFGLCGCSLFTVVLDAADQGTIQQLHVGDSLVIRLMGTPSTGYEWVRIQPEVWGDGPIDIVAEGEFEACSNGLIGSPGEYVFRYRAMRQGTTVLGFAYRRPWEKDEAADLYEVTIWVR